MNDQGSSEVWLRSGQPNFILKVFQQTKYIKSPDKIKSPSSAHVLNVKQWSFLRKHISPVTKASLGHVVIHLSSFPVDHSRGATNWHMDQGGQRPDQRQIEQAKT